MLVSVFFLLLSASLNNSQKACQRRDLGKFGWICVCNSTYCDTIPRPEKLEAPQYIKYTTNKAGLIFDKEIGTFQLTNAIDKREIIVHSEQTFQPILGWGGAFTDATGVNVKSLPQQAQEKLLGSYFSNDGLEYSVCRVPMGGTDFSLRGYSYDDGGVDKELKNFKLASEDLDYKIPLIQIALNLTGGNLKLFASTWTAPKWMKTNGQYDGIGFLIEEMYQSWADYFVKFLDHYAEQNIHFWGLTTGNEPSLGFLPRILNKINSVAWTSSQMRKFIVNNLGPTIRKSNYSSVKIMIIDDQRLFLPWYPAALFSNKTAREYVDGIAVHWYADSIVPAAVLTATHDLFPEKFILASEACNGATSWKPHVILGSWDRGEKYANSIIEDLHHWAEGWLDWNMALDLTGGPTYIGNNVDSPILVNATAGEFYKQPTFYALGHFAKFIPRGSRRIYTSNIDKNVPSVAFKRPDNSTVMVILNREAKTIPVTIVDHSRGASRIILSAKSITTLVYW